MGAVSSKTIKADGELRGVRAEFRGEEIRSVPPSALIRSRWPHGKPAIGIETDTTPGNSGRTPRPFDCFRYTTMNLGVPVPTAVDMPDAQRIAARAE